MIAIDTAPPRHLAGIEVLECGERIAVTACGSLLAALGARVSVIEADSVATAALPPAHLAGKTRLAANDRARVASSLERADVILTSTDVTALAEYARSPQQIVCDVTAYGSSGPMAGLAHSDPLIQAISGLADTTGEPDGPPTLCPFPQVEGIAALYAAAGILAALRARSRSGLGQTVEIALFDCAFSTLSTFLPFHFIGKSVTRSGNRHVLASPWNAYRARGAWLLICTGSDEQWKRLCDVIARPDLGADVRLGKAEDRVRHRDRVDAAVQQWIAERSAGDAASALQARGIAAGAVVAAAELAQEPNIAHRGLYSSAGMSSAIRYFNDGPAHALPAAREVQCALDPRSPASPADRPLAGVRVLELGQYTTAPLVARNLGALGAEVLKIEPPGGDATRAWPPQRDGQGYFFTLSNSDKRSLCLDLRNTAERSRFEHLLTQTDVLVENLKPGSLDKLGIDEATRNRLNPQLVYCAISGFGAESAYPGRPAFDTVVQAMSGIMDLVRTRGVPQKTGISYADVLGGLFALVGTLAALVARSRTGAGAAIDISMQDAAAWITQWRTPTAQATVLKCLDGYVCVETALTGDPIDIATVARAEAVRLLGERGLSAAPVNTVSEAAQSPQAIARRVLRDARDCVGREWQVFASPIRWLGAAEPQHRAIGPLGETNAEAPYPPR